MNDVIDTIQSDPTIRVTPDDFTPTSRDVVRYDAASYARDYIQDAFVTGELWTYRKPREHTDALYLRLGNSGPARLAAVIAPLVDQI